MAKISFSRTALNPVNPPIYDPRDGEGISFHVNTATNKIWLGLSKTGAEKWGRFSSTGTVTGGGSIGAFNRDFPVVTTSSTAPDFAPQFVPADGKLHLHITYTGSAYNMYLGTGKITITWERYDFNLTIA